MFRELGVGASLVFKRSDTFGRGLLAGVHAVGKVCMKTRSVKMDQKRRVGLVINVKFGMEAWGHGFCREIMSRRLGNAQGTEDYSVEQT